MSQQENKQIDAFLKSDLFSIFDGTKKVIENWESFKASHSSSEKVDLEIVRMKSEVDCKFPTVYFDLQPNGKFVSEEWPNEEFDLKEDLLENKIGKKYSIVSVRRLSDGVVFSIGDMCDTFFLGKIEYIRVNGKHCTVGGEKWGCPLQSAKKAPIPEEKPVPVLLTQPQIDKLMLLLK